MTGPAGGRRDDWAELRRLLVDPEQRELALVKSRLDRLQRISPEEVGAVLPQAIAHSISKGRQIHEALLPVIEEDIALSVKRNPRPLADALFPVMGPAIRRAIADALKGLLQSIDELVDHSVSPRALRWRFEAWRTRTPLSHVIFRHTMLYRVEQVFLIHRETGLLLQHVASGPAVVQDPDTVSGMLTAIQDFVRDSFKTKQGDTLDEIAVGELTVWIEHGPSAAVAGVMRGRPPRELRFVFDDALAEIHQEQSDALEAFAGDTAPFAAARPHLEACLQFQKDAVEQTRATARTLKPAYIVCAALLAALAVSAFFQVRSQGRWNSYLARLAKEPGIVVMRAENGWTTYAIDGLRDPLAADPRGFLSEQQIDPARVVSRWQPYEALDPPIVFARAKRVLDPPDTVSLQMTPEGVLTAAGAAPSHWIADARRLARALSGVARFDDAQVTATERQQVVQLVEKIQAYNVLFLEGSPQPLPESRQTVESLTADLDRLATLGTASGQGVAITLVGHTDGSGTEGLNKPLSARRADAIVAALKPALPRGLALATRGVSNAEPFKPEVTAADRAWNRRVTVSVTVSDTARDKRSNKGSNTASAPQPGRAP
jgi:outer membrane protein OmpA-like peptidoglycan-associated protein